MRFRVAIVLLMVVAHPSVALAQDWVSASSIAEIEALPAEVEAVELLFQSGTDDRHLLATLAQNRPKLQRLTLVARRGSVLPLAPLSKFKQLTHLEIHDGVSNLCYVDPETRSRELDVVGEMLSLHTLVLDIY